MHLKEDVFIITFFICSKQTFDTAVTTGYFSEKNGSDNRSSDTQNIKFITFHFAR